MFTRLLLLMAAAALAALFAQDNPAPRIDEILHQWDKPATPGASVAVIQAGKVIFQKGYGIANLEYDIPVAPDTVFHVASVSKQFTAMCIVLLEQENKLSLEDDVHKYLPELPDYGHTITIRNLLQHTSGIRDQWQTLGVAGWRLDDVITQSQILRILFRQRELNFAPGSQHLYSNSGFTLLAEIVKRVSGKPLPEFANERIFEPLGMARTHFHLDHQRIVPGRAYSYESAPGGGFRASPLNYANVGATSLFTTAPDLAKWLDNFRDPKVGGAKAVARMQEEAVLTDGKKVPYALGLQIGQYRGLRTVSHGGADAGYRSYVVWFPEQQLGVAVLSNLANFNPGNIGNRVAAVYLEKQMKPLPQPATPPAATERTFITLEPAVTKQYVGFYRVGDVEIQITQKDGKLFGAPNGNAPIELKPVSATKFFVPQMGNEVEFTPQPNNGMTLKLPTPDGGVSGERLIPLAPQDLAQYVGAYWSDELETQYTFVLKDGKLIADHAHHGEIALRPAAKDEFHTSEWFMPNVKFERNAAGAVIAVSLGGGRLTGIRFAKR